MNISNFYTQNKRTRLYDNILSFNVNLSKMINFLHVTSVKLGNIQDVI